MSGTIFKEANDAIQVIMDDETYINMNGHDFSGDKYYFDSGEKDIDDHIKYKEKETYGMNCYQF